MQKSRIYQWLSTRSIKTHIIRRIRIHSIGYRFHHQVSIFSTELSFFVPSGGKFNQAEMPLKERPKASKCVTFFLVLPLFNPSKVLNRHVLSQSILTQVCIKGSMILIIVFTSIHGPCPVLPEQNR